MCDTVHEPDLMDSYVGQGLQILNHTDTERIDLICNAWLGEKDGNVITEKNHSLKIKCKNLPAVAGWYFFSPVRTKQHRRGRGFQKF